MYKIPDINTFLPTGKIDKKHLLWLMDYSPEEILEVLHRAKKLKAEYKGGAVHDVLNGKTIALIFTKASTRTRLSFEMGIRQLGGQALFLSGSDIQLGRGEPISDTVRVMQSYGIDGIMIRTYEQDDLNMLAQYGNIPIINGLTDLCHPCQALCDLLTIWEIKGKLKGVKLAYFGDGNNMANSLLLACAKAGMDIAIACPNSYPPDSGFLAEAKKYNGNILITDNPQAAAIGSDVLYTDVFFSMGQEPDQQKYDAMMRFQVNRRLLSFAKPDATFLHCLPAHRGEEVTADVIDDEKVSAVFLQAENRLHAQKGVMSLLFENKG